MTATWLPRRADGRSRLGAPLRLGEALTRAVTAWADEMFCGDEGLPTRITLLVGYLGTADIVDHLLGRGVRLESIDAPARYGLLPAR